MAAAFGILVRGKVKPGKYDELRAIADGHMARQLDGREAGAMCCAILEPSEEEADTFSFFEQWRTKADHEAHEVHDNIHLFKKLAGPLFDSIEVVKLSMKHYERHAHSGRKYGILVEGKVKKGKMVDMLKEADAHFNRQLDGREPNATCATIMEATAEAPDTIRFFEQWDSKRDYAAHSKPNDNLKVFMETAGSLWDGDVSVKEHSMQHYERSMPGVSGPPTGATEMRVTTKKSATFYVKSVVSFFCGVEARPAEDGKDAVEAKLAVEFLRISGLGDAVGVAVSAAAQIEAEGIGQILKTQTAYPPMPGSGRGCAQIVIDLKRK